MEEELIPFAIVGAVLFLIVIAVGLYIKFIEFKYNLAQNIKEEIKKEQQSNKENNKEITGRAIIEDDEFDLICRALSDSMNYKRNEKFNEKWNLLLKLKTIEHLARKEMEDK